MGWMMEKTNRFQSELITAFVGIDSNGVVDLEWVDGNKNVESGMSLSDVEWFFDFWYGYGSEDIQKILCSKGWGRFRVVGRLYCWQNNTPDDMDWEEEFEILDIHRIGMGG